MHKFTLSKRTIPYRTVKNIPTESDRYGIVFCEVLFVIYAWIHPFNYYFNKKQMLQNCPSNPIMLIVLLKHYPIILWIRTVNNRGRCFRTLPFPSVAYWRGRWEGRRPVRFLEMLFFLNFCSNLGAINKKEIFTDTFLKMPFFNICPPLKIFSIRHCACALPNSLKQFRNTKSSANSNE